jgi:hypothetical protein
MSFGSPPKVKVKSVFSAGLERTGLELAGLERATLERADVKRADVERARSVSVSV